LADLDRLFARLAKHQPAPPLDAPEFDAHITGCQSRQWCELPGDFLAFYKHCDGVGLFGDALRFRPLDAVEGVEGVTTRRPDDCPEYLAQWDVGPWVRFGDLADGSFVVIELSHTSERGWKVVRVGPDRGETSRIIARSFAKFLGKALAGDLAVERFLTSAVGVGRITAKRGNRRAEDARAVPGHPASESG
jgi:hypothetical protein